MQTYDKIKDFLSEGEQAAVEALIAAGWIPFADAMIESAEAEGYRYPTYNVGGRYQFCLTANGLQDRQPPAAKKRGRPKKLKA
jgi:hypothetical protein